MAITALPTPPSRQDPTNFNDRADAFLGALPVFATEANTLQTNVNTSESNAVAAAAAVFAATNIVKWVSGTTYANGAVVWSPINGLSYRRITASGSGTTDPSLDTTNYLQINGTGNVSTVGDQSIAGTKTFTSTIVGNISGNSGTTTLAVKASTVSSGGGNGTAIQFTWSGLGGQPTWLFGGDTPGNVNVYNPSNFSVNYANSSGELVQNQYAGPYYYTLANTNGSKVVGTGFTKVGGRIRVSIAGSVRIKLVGGFDPYGWSGYFKIYRNGVAITGDLYSNPELTWEGDFSCGIGDTFEVYARTTNYTNTVNVILSPGFSDVHYRAPAVSWIY